MVTENGGRGTSRHAETRHFKVYKFNLCIYQSLVMLYSMKTVLFDEVCCLQAHNAVLHSESLLEIRCCLVVIL